MGVSVYAHINNKYLKEKTKKHNQHWRRKKKKKKPDEQCARVEQTKVLYNITICAFAIYIYVYIELIRKIQ